MTDASPGGPPEAPPASPAAITHPSAQGFFAADYVASPGDSKVYVVGGFFSLLRFPSFPFILSNLGVVAVIEIPFHEVHRDHTAIIGLRGPSDEELPLRVEARFRTPSTSDAHFGEPHIVPLAANVVNVEFRQPGVYHLVLSLDGTEIARYRFRSAQDAAATLRQGA
jgi:hypothetical protein